MDWITFGTAAPKHSKETPNCTVRQRRVYIPRIFWSLLVVIPINDPFTLVWCEEKNQRESERERESARERVCVYTNR